jgi:MoxR-like ATPase
MAIRDISAPEAVEAALQEFDERGRDAFLRKYGFHRARRFLIERNGRLYDSKAILGAAHGYQFPEQGPLLPDEFSGGEATTARKLRELGLTVVATDQVNDEAEDARPIGDVIGEVLALQPSWTKDNTPEMQVRGVLVRKDAVRSLRRLLPPQATLPFRAEVEGQDGSGLKARVPWVRVFSRSQSPSAMTGWYVVLLFAADGSAAYLTLGTGITMVENGVTKPRPAAWVVERIQWARSLLGDSAEEGLVSEIDLADPQGLGAQYEAGTAFAYPFHAESEIDDERFSARLQHLLTLLSELYSHGDPELETQTPATEGAAIHLLLKWSPADDPDTLDKHLAVAAAHGGRVWWGNFTRGTRRAGDGRVAVIRRQLEAGTQTNAYLYRSGPNPAVWRATIEAITNKRDEVDSDRLPGYYAPEQNHSVYVLLHDIERADLEWVADNLTIASKPIAGALAPALRTQTSPLYLIHVPGRNATEPVVDTGSSLTREWLGDTCLWSDAELEESLSALLGVSPQVILAGPPGTGKSWVAQAVARYLTKDRPRQWRLVQLHPSYGYESLIEGLRPVTDNGAISFERVDGTVLRMTEAARLNDLPHVLILDEMNRANLPRVLGELMFLFEYRDQLVDLQYSQGFTLPENLLFIGTMNTADRSIRSIDVALRRRFEIFECLPDSEVLARFYKAGSGSNFVPDLIEGFIALNDELETQLDRHHTIGQTFFMTDEMTGERLRRVWDRKILPLIEEYFFDLPDVAAEFALPRFWPSANA